MTKGYVGETGFTGLGGGGGQPSFRHDTTGIDLTDQPIIVGQDLPQAITLGPAQGTPSDMVQIIGNGGVRFNRDCTVMIRFTYHIARTTTSGTSIIAVWHDFNGMQVSETESHSLPTSTSGGSKSATYYHDFTSGDILTFFMASSSDGANDGGLFERTFPVTMDTDPVGSAFIDITELINV